MPENKKEIPLRINNQDIVLTIFGEGEKATIFEIFDAPENGEALFQIKEGCFYEYRITDGFSLDAKDIISVSKINKSLGRIAPNIYVGTLSINVIETATNDIVGEIKLEVQSVKTSYRQDYRYMLEEITEKCTDLLLQHNSLVSHFFETDFNTDSSTLYQRFAFIKSILDTDEFNDSIHKIISSPVTKWKETENIKDIRSVKRINNSSLRQISSANNRIDLQENYLLGLNSIPSKIKVQCKSETPDTPENRFVKHALLYFQSFLGDFKNKVQSNSRLFLEVIQLETKLEQHLNASVFKEISSPKTLPLNSPVLQRKEGYREVLRIWLMFDLAAKLVWRGGEDVYSGGKRDIAILYEYWLFFKLLDIIKDIFKIDPLSIEKLIEQTKDGLGLKLKQGQFLPVKGIYATSTRKLNIEFSYNKTFGGQNEYPKGGSWSRSMRPDYTLSIWPDIDAQTAEKEELMVHIHFDAKYKVDKLQEIFGNDEDLLNEKDQQRKGTFKRADLLKMHSYKDAIRRTAGAYILYPGSEAPYKKTGFHELIPGLGAFAIRPSKVNDGTIELKRFLNEVIIHFLNRASQREKISLKTYEIYKDKDAAELNELLPEAYGASRNLLPDSTFVIVGYYKKDKFDWIINNGLYNARTGNARGALVLGPNEAGAKYLLLHTEDETTTSKLFKIIANGPTIFSKQNLIDKGYLVPTQDFYLVYKIEPVNQNEFLNRQWDVSKLDGYKTGRNAALPFSATLSELMRAIVK